MTHAECHGWISDPSLCTDAQGTAWPQRAGQDLAQTCTDSGALSLGLDPRFRPAQGLVPSRHSISASQTPCTNTGRKQVFYKRGAMASLPAAALPHSGVFVPAVVPPRACCKLGGAARLAPTRTNRHQRCEGGPGTGSAVAFARTLRALRFITQKIWALKGSIWRGGRRAALPRATFMPLCLFSIALRQPKEGDF